MNNYMCIDWWWMAVCLGIPVNDQITTHKWAINCLLVHMYTKKHDQDTDIRASDQVLFPRSSEPGPNTGICQKKPINFYSSLCTMEQWLRSIYGCQATTSGCWATNRLMHGCLLLWPHNLPCSIVNSLKYILYHPIRTLSINLHI